MEKIDTAALFFVFLIKYKQQKQLNLIFRIYKIFNQGVGQNVKVLIESQDTVVLGKNAEHSFGRAQDWVSPPTLYSKRTTIDAREKGDEFGNEDWNKAKRMTIDTLNEHARNKNSVSILTLNKEHEITLCIS